MKIASFFKVLFLFLLSTGFLQAQDIVYTENFNDDIGQGNDGGVVNLSAVDWTLNTDACNIETGDYVKVVETGDDRLESLDSDGEAVWMSPIIDISSYSDIDISVYTAETGSGSNPDNKYIKLYYILDGGSEVSFFESAVDWGNSTATINNLNGNTLQLVARMKTTYSSDKIYIDDISVKGILNTVSNDALTQLLSPVSQIPSQTISSVINDESSSQTLLKFALSESASSDNLDTKIASIKFNNIASINQADLLTQFEGFSIYDGSNFIPTSSISIGTDEVTLSFTEGNFSLLNNSSQEYELRGFLKSSGILDGEIVAMELEASDITTYNSGSAFDIGGSVAVNSPEHQVSVIATQLNFTSIPTSSLIKNTNFSVSVNASDANGNLDIDANQNVDLSIHTGTGLLAGVLSKALLNGELVFADLTYNMAENISIQILSAGLVTAISDPISIISSQSTGLTLSSWIPSPLNISSISNTADDAVEVYRFSINDMGDDLESTFVNKIRLIPGDGNNVIWENVLAGLVVKVGGDILETTYVVSNSAIDITISSSESLREVSDGNSKIFSIFAYLKTELNDGEILQMNIESSHSEWLTSGSGFVPSFVGDLNGPEFKINVTGTRLNFTSIPMEDVEFASNFDVSVNLTDINNNLDVDANQEVSLSLVDGNGNLSGSLTKNLSLGIASFDDLSYNYSESINLVISGNGFNSDASELIHILPSNSSISQVVDWIPEDLFISSLSVFEDDFKEVLRFQVADNGDDRVSSVLKTIRLISGSENTMDWEDNIGGFRLKINDQIADANFIQSASSLLINFAENEELANIPDGQTIDLSLYVYLDQRSIDGQIFQAAIENVHSQWEIVGTQFLPEFTGNLEGESFVVEVEGSELSFTEKPPKTLIPNTDFGMELKLVDKFGNQDLNSTKEARVSLASGTGNLTSDIGLSVSLINGKYVWTDLRYDKAENFTLLVEADGLESILTDNISSLDANSSLIYSDTPILKQVLNPLSIDIENSEAVLNFVIKDEASRDNLPTQVSSMKFYNGLMDSGLDWTKHIAGAIIKSNGEIVAKTTNIENDYISFSSADIVIENGEEKEFELAIYFKKSLIPDHAKFQVEIRKDHEWKTSTTGSSLTDELLEGIQSPIHEIDVNADRLSFISYPNGIENLENFKITIAAVDEFQNIDIDHSSSISLSSESGDLSQTGLVGNLEDGVLEVDDLSFSGDQKLELTASSDLQSVTKEIFVQAKNIIFSDDFESKSLSLWEHVDAWTASSYKPIKGSFSLKHNLTNATGSSYIICPLNNIKVGSESIFWEFILQNSDWDPTSSNNFVFHLLIDSNNPELANTVYSVGVNLSGSDDYLSLWANKDENTEQIIKSDFDWNRSETVAVKVEYNSNGQWILSYNRLGNNSHWFNAGTAISEVKTDIENWYSGLAFNFETASRAGELWFDDLKIETYNTAPYLKNYELSSDSIVLNFSEDLNISESSKPENFEFSLGDEPVQIKEIKSTNLNNQLVLMFENTLVTGNYNLKVSSVEDLEGAISKAEIIQFDFYGDVHLHDLVINEIFADESPVVGLPEYEFIEIYNTSDYPINIKDYKLKVGNTEKIISDFEIPSKAYLILCSNAAVEYYKEFGNVLGISGFPSLTNSGTNISLESSSGILLDEVTYSSDWYGDDEKADGGWSLERVDASNFCSTGSNWSVSENMEGGTPGGENSIKGIYQDTQVPELVSYLLLSNQELQVEFSEALVDESVMLLSNYTIETNAVSSVIKESDNVFKLNFSGVFHDGDTHRLTMNNLEDECGNSQEISFDFIWHDVHLHDLVINEIFADESPVVGLPEYEFIEIYNTSDYPINIKDYKLKVGNTEKIISDFEIPSKAYLILCSNAAVEYYKEFGNVLGVSGFPSLTNSGTNISLESSSGILLDEVTYSSDWYGDDEKADGGWSLERIDASNFCSTVSNWLASENMAGGTPGEDNSIKGIYVDQVAPELVSYQLLSNQELQVEFSEVLVDESVMLLSNYTIETNAVSSVIKESDKVFKLSFSAAFLDGDTHRLTMNNLEDECGNSQEISFDFIWHDVHLHDLVINEIFADESPAVGLPEYEFIEIYNISDYPINIKDYKLKVGNTEKIISDFEIPSKAYLILCSNAAVEYYKEFGNVLGVSGFPSLTNSGTNISLESSSGILLDEVTYSSDWYGDDEKTDGGWSLERIDASNFCSTVSNWSASESMVGGTPGGENSIKGIYVDQVAPELVSYQLLSNQALQVEFSEPLVDESVMLLSNYMIETNAVSSVIKESDKVFKLSFSAAFQDGADQQLIMNNLEDECGNSQEISFDFIWHDVHLHDLVINEIFADESPAVGLPEYEFIEIYNISDYPINIKDYKLKVGNTEKILSDFEIPSKAYLILCSNAAVEYYKEFGNVLGVSGFPSLTNSGTNISLESSSGILLDEVTYSSDWYGDDEKTDGGWSLERIDASNFCSTVSNWSASESMVGGTPGGENSIKGIYVDQVAPELVSYQLLSNQALQVEFSEPLVDESVMLLSNYMIETNAVSSVIKESDKVFKLSFSAAFQDGADQQLIMNNLEDECGNSQEISFDFIWHDVHLHDLVINEIFADESPAVGLPEYEFIEIYNTSDYPINIKDYKLKVGNTEKILSDYELSSHEYLILCSNAAVEYYKEFGNVLGVSGFPSLTNSGTNISLESSSGILLDEVTYSLDWYGDDEKADGGWSLERIDASNFCSTVNNWSASENMAGGTPGGENSIKGIYVDQVAPELVSYQLLSNQALQVEFSEALVDESVMLLSNYTIETNAVSSVIKESDKVFKLNFSGVFHDGDTQQLIMNNIEDECGNSQKISFDFIWHDVHLHDLVINEIFADESPVVGLPEYEFIEIYNTSYYPINIKDYKLKVGNTEKIISDFEIPSKAYLILCSNAAVEYYKEFGNVLGVSGFPSLTNSGTNISLESSSGILLDEVTYSSDWYGDDEKADGGWSLERIDASNFCSTVNNWSASENMEGGTPGGENSIKGIYQDTQVPELVSYQLLSNQELQVEFSEALVDESVMLLSNYTIEMNAVSSVIKESDKVFKLYFSDVFQDGATQQLTMNNLEDECGNSQEISFDFIWHDVHLHDLVINEIFADESPAVGLPEYEFIEIYNTSDYPINIKDYKLKVGNTEKIISDFEIPSKAYLILCSNAAVEYYNEFGNVLGVSGFPSLTNSGASISIESSSSVLLDEVTYSSDWYGDDEKADGGWSLERIDASNFCSTVSNWLASENMAGGTPGGENSIKGIYQDTQVPELVSYQLLSNQVLQVEFSEALVDESVMLLSNYTIETNAVSSVIKESDKVFKLNFSGAFQDGADQQLTMNNIEDECGNSQEISFDFIWHDVHLHDLVINEIFADESPVVGLPEYEFIEIYNTSDYPINIKDYKLKVGNTEKILSDYELSSHEYIILCSNAVVGFYEAYGHVLGVSSFPSLTNSGTNISLESASSVLLDEVTYSSDWYGDDEKADGGWSLERIDVTNYSWQADNWRASIDVKGGTPGQINSIVDNNKDETAPILLSFDIEQSNSILLYFSETLKSPQAYLLENYSVDNGIGYPNSIVEIEDDRFALRLTFSSNFESNTPYQFNLSDQLSDLEGNLFVEREFKFLLADIPRKGDLVINEVLFNPYPNGADYVELLNISDRIVDVKDLLIANRDDNYQIDQSYYISEKSYLLEAGAYLLITTDTANVKMNYSYRDEMAFLQIDRMPSYGDDEGRVVLLNTNDEQIDDFAYDESMQFSQLVSDEGVALERINPEKETNSRSNWISASQTSDFGTPGMQNSSYDINQVEVNEIGFKSKLFTPDNDGIDDRLVIYFNLEKSGYVANIRIYNSRGIEIKRLASNLTLSTHDELFWDGLLANKARAPFGIYIVYFELFNPDGDVKVYKKTCVLGGKFK